MHWGEQYTYWNQMAVRIVNVQYVELQPGEQQALLLPSSQFLFSMKGSAEIKLGNQMQQADRFCVMHCGYEGSLSISALEKGFVYYLVAYSPLLTLDQLQIDGGEDPACLHYIVLPDNPLILLRSFDAMHTCWQQSGPFQQLHLRRHFYTFVHQLLLQFVESELTMSRADVVGEALNYLEDHFLEPITLDELSEKTDSSARHLARLFKNRTGLSPIEYVIRLRMNYAKQLLQLTDATLQEIASGMGYADHYSFSKMFKKHVGQPPIRYRMQTAECANFPKASAAAIRFAPYRPKRIVALYLVGDVLSFGVTPIGISDIYDGCSLQHRLNDAVILGEWYRPDLEQIRMLQPDLIIAPSAQTFEMLKGIAPVIYIDYEWPLEQRMSRLSEWLGSYHNFSQRIEQFHEKIEVSKQKLHEAGLLDKTITIVEGGRNGIELVASKVYGRGSHIIYHYLGLKAPAKLQDSIDRAVQASGLHIPLNQLNDYAGDFIFRSTYTGMPNLSDQAEWSSLSAVQEGRLIDISFGLSYYNDLYSLDQQLTDIVNKLLIAAR